MSTDLPIKDQILLKKLETAIADAELARTVAAAAALAHAKDEIEFYTEQAGDHAHRILRFVYPITSDTMAGMIDILSRWDRLDTDPQAATKGYTIYLTTPGGDVMAGLSAYNFLVQLAKRRPVTIIASGLVASMGTILHQAGSTRLIERGTSYLIHDVSAGASGDVSKIMDHAKWMTRLNGQLHEILAERSTMTVEEVSVLCERRDWVLTSEEAVERGFADAIA